MSVSLETRVPLLDPEVVEFAWRVPLGFKIRAARPNGCCVSCSTATSPPS